MSSSNSSSSSDASSQFFETGPNLLLCKIPGLDQPSFPEEFQDSWDNAHVRLPCSKRHYNDISQWPEIVEGLKTKIVNTDQLSEVMLRWNKAKEQTWNIKVLEYFLNAHSLYESTHDQGTLSEEAEILDEEDRLATKDRFDSQDDSHDDEEDRILDEEHHKKWLEAQRQEHALRQLEQGSSNSPLSASNAWTSSSSPPLSSAPLKSQYLSSQERTRFFDVILPKMQALALRLPELVHKPVPFLMQQQDSAITLSQEQIACLLANAFFNTFPCRNVPNKRSRRFTKKPGFKRSNSSGGQQQNDQPEDDEDDSEDSNDEANDRKAPKRKDKSSASTTKATRGGASSRGGSANRGGRGGGQASGRGGKKNMFSTTNEPRPPRKRRAKGIAALFEFFEDGEPSELCARLKAESLSELASGVENLAVAEDAKEKKDERGPKMPSINFISLFWAEDTSSLTPCSTAQAAKLRCIMHYFDRVTTEMPTGTVTYHRQVIRKPVYLKAGQDAGELNGFHFHKVNVDSVTPLEEAPQGALQMDFANKNIGGGALDRGAVQEEIRFMICPELIISRLFTTQLEANESLLIKGAERYSNYIGYSKTFEWYSDHKDPVPRDALGRRMTNICAIDATPFKSKISRLNQFERYSILREFNKCLVGFRPSIHLQDSLTPHTVATGNWGCGAFGGDMQLKFVIQWMAASVLRESNAIGTGSNVSNDDMLLYYYTFGIPALQLEIENFLKVVESSGKTIDPKRVVDCIIQYPRRNQFGEIQSFREKSLLEYLGTAITFVPSSTDAP